MNAVNASTSSAVEGECFGTNLLNLVTVGHLMLTQVQSHGVWIANSSINWPKFAKGQKVRYHFHGFVMTETHQHCVFGGGSRVRNKTVKVHRTFLNRPMNRWRHGRAKLRNHILVLDNLVDTSCMIITESSQIIPTVLYVLETITFCKGNYAAIKSNGRVPRPLRILNETRRKTVVRPLRSATSQGENCRSQKKKS